MSVKYMYQNQKPVAQIWTEEDKTGYVVITGMVLVACIATGIAWWKINKR